MKKNIYSGGLKLTGISLGLMFSSFILLAKGPTQDLSKTVIAFEIKHGNLKQAFKIIENETRFFFTFKTEDVLRYSDLNFSSPAISVDKLLNTLLSGTNLGYQQVDNNIIIKKNSLLADSPQQMNENADLVFEGGIRGKVTNEKGEPVGGASISIEGLKKGVAADANGEFSLSGLKEGIYQMTVTAVGYNTEIHSVVVNENKITEISFQLKMATNNLNDVVVTALGINRSVRSLGYSSQ